MPRYRLPIDVPVFIDRVIVWPVLAWRWFWYDHTFRRVRLLPDKYAKVDPRDYHDVSKYTWWARKTPRSYTAIRFIEKGRVLVPVHMHRQIMLKKLNPESGELPANLLVDHKNRDATDNRRANLRLATTSQNSMNRRKCKGTSSKYKGVSWDNRKELWKAAVQVDRKNRHLGYFESETEAAKVYDAAARKYHGEFAYQNFEDENRRLTRRAKIRKIIRRINHRLFTKDWYRHRFLRRQARRQRTEPNRRWGIFQKRFFSSLINRYNGPGVLPGFLFTGSGDADSTGTDKSGSG